MDLKHAESRIETLVAELGEPGEELVRLLMGLYQDAFGRIVDLLKRDDLERLAADDLVGSLLILHDLHPYSTEDRVVRALDEVRPYLGSHAGGVELLGLGEDGIVRLRLRGTCEGCPSSVVTVKQAIERAILDAAPEVAGIEVENLEAEPRLLQIRSGPPLECPTELRP